MAGVGGVWRHRQVDGGPLLEDWEGKKQDG